MRKQIFALAGEGQRNADGSKRQDVLLRCEPGDRVLLVRESANSYDRNAIRVETLNGEGIGYIGRDDAASLAPALDAGRPHLAQIHELTGGLPDYPRYGCRISIAWDGKVPKGAIPLDEAQQRSRRAKAEAAGRVRDQDGRFANSDSGCLVVAVAMPLLAVGVAMAFATVAA